MADLARRHHRALDRAPDRDEIPEPFRRHLETDARGVDERVVRAAEREVVAHLADARHLYTVVERDHERRHVLERDASHARPFAARSRGHASRRCVEANDRTLAEQTNLERDGHQSDYAVATHRAPAFVVHEEDAGVAIRGDRIRRDRSIHVGMPPRFEHQAAPKFVEAPAGKAALLEDGRAWNGVEAAGYDP